MQTRTFRGVGCSRRWNANWRIDMLVPSGFGTVNCLDDVHEPQGYFCYCDWAAVGRAESKTRPDLRRDLDKCNNLYIMNTVTLARRILPGSGSHEGSGANAGEHRDVLKSATASAMWQGCQNPCWHPGTLGTLDLQPPDPSGHLK
jgi:hypothetical protein